MADPAKKARPASILVVGQSSRSRRLARRREDLRDSLWPDSAALVWSRRRFKGFTTLPRTLPLIARLISELTPKGDASKVYLDLWFRSFDEGLVAVHDEEDMAFTAGYDGPRATRTWREHIESLVELGFIWTKQLGNRDVGQILLLDPHLVVADLRAEKRVRDEWWNAFITRMHEIGATLPTSSSVPQG